MCGAILHRPGLRLKRPLTILIIEQELKYFSDINLSELVGSEVQVCGLIYDRKKRLRMRLRHDVDLRILKSPSKKKNSNK